MTETLQINPKFEQIIPPLSDEEFTQLEENILKVGRVTDPMLCVTMELLMPEKHFLRDLDAVIAHIEINASVANRNIN